MEFTALFLAVTIVMLVAWRGSRPLTLGLFAAVLTACVATYLLHATDTLKLSFWDAHDPNPSPGRSALMVSASVVGMPCGFAFSHYLLMLAW